MDGGHSAALTNFGGNDARFAQTVRVEPDSLYRLSGYVRASEVEDSGWGANLSVGGVYLSVEGFFDTEGEWCYTETYGETGPDQTEVTVFARLGGYSGESVGSAWFDGLSLVKVDMLPEGAEASLWYQDDTVYYDDGDDILGDDEEETASAFWPWLLAISALYLLLGAWMALKLPLDRRSLREKKGMPLFAVVGLVLAFLVRLFIAWRVDGYQVDVNCFIAWGSTMASSGPGAFYSATSFCDYPPAYMLVLGLNELVARGLTGLFGGTLPSLLRREVLIKLLPMLSDLGMAGLTYRVSREHRMSREQSGLLCLLVAFCPALICNSAAWCQVDAVLCLLLALTVWLALRHRWDLLMPIYMLAVLCKPQALMAGPLGLLALACEFMPGLARRDEAEAGTKCPFFALPDRSRLRGMLIGLGGALGVAVVIVLPFALGQGGLSWLIDRYAETLSSYPYATVNTANLYYLFGGNWSALELTAHWGVCLVLCAVCAGWGVWHGLALRREKAPFAWLEPVLMAAFALFFLLGACLGWSWGTVGTGAMVLAFAVTMPLFLRSGRMETLPLMGALLFLLLYVLGIKMHERYLFPALILLAMAFAVHRDLRVLALLALLSCTMLVNEGIVLDNSIRLGSTMGHLNNDTYGLNMIVSLLNVLTVPLALWACGDLCLKGDAPLKEKASALLPAREPASVRSFTTDPKLHWHRLDTILVLAVTAAYSVLALTNLGSTKAPQTTWASTTAQEQVVLDLGRSYDGFAIAYYCEVSYSNFTLETSEDGETWSEVYWAEMNEGKCYQWSYVMPSHLSNGTVYFDGGNHLDDVQRFSGRYVRVSAKQIGLKLGELIFRDAEGNGITAAVVSRTGEDTRSSLLSDPSYIVDEPDSLEGEPGWYNSTYFDEIYHARTAKEIVDGTSPYEWTHPPLGKVLMSWCVRIFGMTPFGWRFAGTLMGILMLPAMYLLAKQLTKRTGMAFAAMALMALDCMHFTQTRIATIDSFPVLFIIVAFFFMARFMQHDLMKAELGALFRELALCGLFFGLAVASKWIGLYAGAGLAVLYFWTLCRHIRLSREAAALLSAGGVSPAEKAELQARVTGLWKRLLILCLWCVLAFIVVPVAIYLLSYVPHMAYARPASFSAFLKLVIQVQESMFSYHSTPGLGMDHAFYSPWYEWPLITRPMYYAMAEYMPSGWSQSIFSFGNPAVWLTGLAGIAFTVILWAKRHLYSLPGSEQPVRVRASSWDIAPAFVLVGLLAEFLPWVLVPRGTYIYHYFASIPFLILGIVLLLHHLTLRFPRAGRLVTIVYLVFTLVCFIVFFPYASGLPTPTWWLDFAKQFLHVYYST